MLGLLSFVAMLGKVLLLLLNKLVLQIMEAWSYGSGIKYSTVMSNERAWRMG